MKIQKNIRVSKEVAAWMAAHPLGDTALVNYALHLLMQIEANATRQQLVGSMRIESIPTPEQMAQRLPF